MARYTGPTTKKARAFGEPIFGYDKAYEKKISSWTTWSDEET